MSVCYLIWIHIWILQFLYLSSQSLTSTFIFTGQSHRESSTVFYTTGTKIDSSSISSDSFLTNYMFTSTSENLVSSSIDFLDSLSIQATSASEFTTVYITEISNQSTIDAVGSYSSPTTLTHDTYQSEVKSEEVTDTFITPSSIRDSVFSDLSTIQTHLSSTVIIPSKTYRTDYARSSESALKDSVSEKVQLENSDTVSMLHSQSVISSISNELTLVSSLQTVDIMSISSESPDASMTSLKEDISILQSPTSSTDVSNSNVLSSSIETSQHVISHTDTLFGIYSLTPTKTYAFSDIISSDTDNTKMYEFSSDPQSLQSDTSSYVPQISDITSLNIISVNLYSSSYMLSSNYMETTINPSIATNVAAKSISSSSSSDLDDAMFTSYSETPMLGESQIFATETEVMESSYFSMQSKSSNYFDNELSEMFSVITDSSELIVSPSVQHSNIFSGTVQSSHIMDNTNTSIIDLSQSGFASTVASVSDRYSSTKSDSDATDIKVSVTASYNSYDGSSGSASETTVSLTTTETLNLSDHIASSSFQQSNVFSATILSTAVFDKTNSPSNEISFSEEMSRFTSETDIFSSTQSVLSTSDVYESITTSFNSLLDSSGTSPQPMTTETSVLFSMTQLDSSFSPLSSNLNSDILSVTLPYSISPTYDTSILPTLPFLSYSTSTEISSSISVDLSTVSSSVENSEISVIPESKPFHATPTSVIGTISTVSRLSEYTLSDKVTVLPSLSSKFNGTEETASVSLSTNASTDITQTSTFQYETVSDMYSVNSSKMFFQTVSVTSKIDLSIFSFSTGQSSSVLESSIPSVAMSTSYSTFMEAYSPSVMFNSTEESGILSTMPLASGGIGSTITSVTYPPESSLTWSMFSEMDSQPITSSLSTAYSSENFESTKLVEMSSHIIVTEPLSLNSFSDLTSMTKSFKSLMTSVMSDIEPMRTSTSLMSEFTTLTAVSEDEYIPSKSSIYTSTMELSELIYSTSTSYISDGSLPSPLFTQPQASTDRSMSILSKESLNIKPTTSSPHEPLTATSAFFTDLPSDIDLPLTRTPQLTSILVSASYIENSSLLSPVETTLSTDKVFISSVTSEIYPLSSKEISSRFSSLSSHDLQTSMDGHSSSGPLYEISSMTLVDSLTLTFSNVNMSTDRAIYTTGYLSRVSTLSTTSNVDYVSTIPSSFSSLSMNSGMLSSYLITTLFIDPATTSHLSSIVQTTSTSISATPTATTSGIAIDRSTIPFETSVDASTTRSRLTNLPKVSVVSSTFTTIFDISIALSTTPAITNIFFTTSISNISITSLTLSTGMSISSSTSLATYPEISISSSTSLSMYPEMSINSSTSLSMYPEMSISSSASLSMYPEMSISSLTSLSMYPEMSISSSTSLSMYPEMSISSSTSLSMYPEMSIHSSTPITEISVTFSTTTSRLPETTTAEPPSQTTPNITYSGENFWVKTVLVARKTTDISGAAFRTDLEARMAEAFNEAFRRERLIEQGVFENLRRKRYATVGEASVHIHDVTRVGDSSSVNVVYAVEKTGTILTPEEAASSLNVLSTQELAIILRQVVQTVAQPYQSTIKPDDTDDGGIPLWLIATIAGAVAGLIILIWLFVCVYVKCCREKKDIEKKGEPELTGIQHASDSNETPRRIQDNERNGRGIHPTVGGAQSGPSSKTSMKKAFTYQVNKADEQALVEHVPKDNSAIETTLPSPAKIHDNNHHSSRVKSPSRHGGTGSHISLSYNPDLQPPTTSSRKSGKLSTRNMEDRSYQGVDYIGNVDSRSRSHSNKYQVQQSSFSDQDNEDLRERLLMERYKNKERIRIKKRKHRPKAYDLPSHYLQNTLGMPSTTLPSVHIESGSPVQKDAELNSPFIKETAIAITNPSSEHSLKEARTRMHRLLDDAFSLISPNASSTEIDQRSQDIQTLLPNEVPPASRNKIFEKTNRDLDPDLRRDDMYVNPAYNQSSFPLETWSPYRTSDLVAMISMPSKAEPTRLGQKPKSATRPLSSKPNRRPAANFDFTESKSASTFDDDRFTTHPGKPIVIRTKDNPDLSSRHSNGRVHSGRTTATVNPLPKPNKNEQYEMNSLKHSRNDSIGIYKSPGVSSKQEDATKDYNLNSENLIKDLRDDLSELKNMYNVSNTTVQRKKNRKQNSSSLTEQV